MRRIVHTRPHIACSLLVGVVACIDVPEEAAEHRFLCASASDCVSGFTCSQGYCTAVANQTNGGGGSMSGGNTADAATSFASPGSGSGSNNPSSGAPDAAASSPSGGSCQPNDHLSCVNESDGSTSVYWFSSCGAMGSIKQYCGFNGCTGSTCNPPMTTTSSNCSHESNCCPKITDSSVRQVCQNDVSSGSESSCAVRLCNIAGAYPACMSDACAVGCAISGC